MEHLIENSNKDVAGIIWEFKQQMEHLEKKQKVHQELFTVMEYRKELIGYRRLDDGTICFVPWRPWRND